MVSHEMPFKRWTHLIPEDPIPIEFPFCIEARVKGWGSLRYRADSNRLRKQTIDRPPEIVDGDRIEERNCGYLAQRMHSGIRSTGSADIDMPAFNPADNLLKDALHGRQSRLYLPAVKVRTVVSNLEPKLPHTLR